MTRDPVVGFGGTLEIHPSRSKIRPFREVEREIESARCVGLDLTRPHVVPKRIVRRPRDGFALSRKLQPSLVAKGDAADPTLDADGLAGSVDASVIDHIPDALITQRVGLEEDWIDRQIVTQPGHHRTVGRRTEGDGGDPIGICARRVGSPKRGDFHSRQR